MIQEDKQLLLVDLCSRLPYGVICQMEDEMIINDSPFYDYILSERHIELFRRHKGFYIKPYLRPMSSITEEEKKSLPFPWVYNFGVITSYSKSEGFVEIEHDECCTIIDWLNKKMLDYRELISKGLALEASEGMYNM